MEADRVEDPPQHLLARGPVRVALAQFFEGVGLLAHLVEGVVGPEDLVHGMEDVTPGGAAGGRPPLGEDEEVIDVAVDVPQQTPTKGEGEPGREVLHVGVLGGGRAAPGGIVIVGGAGVGQLLEVVRRWCLMGVPRGVDEVRHRLGSATEERSAFHIAHRQGEMKADERFGVPRVRRDNKGEAWEVLDAHPDAHVRVREVHLGHVDGA